MNILAIASVAAGEAERQRVGFEGFMRLLRAYRMAMAIHGYAGSELSEDVVRMLVGVVEPLTLGAWRKWPLQFPPNACDHALIPRAMQGWILQANEVMKGDYSSFYSRTAATDIAIREFLVIHPFVDGNGRMAWLLRTWMLYQWDDPEPLPDYFGG